MSIKVNRTGVSTDNHLVTGGYTNTLTALTALDKTVANTVLKVGYSKADDNATLALNEQVLSTITATDISAIAEVMYNGRLPSVENDLVTGIRNMTESSLVVLDSMATKLATVDSNRRSKVNNVTNGIYPDRDTYGYMVIVGTGLNIAVLDGDYDECVRILDTIPHPDIQENLQSFVSITAAIEGKLLILESSMIDYGAANGIELIANNIVSHLLGKLSSDTNHAPSNKALVNSLRLITARDPNWSTRYALGLETPFVISDRSRKAIMDGMRPSSEPTDVQVVEEDDIVVLIAMSNTVHTLNLDPKRII